MQGKSNKPRWALVGTSVILLLCFIGVLLFRGVVLGLYQVDVFSTAQISAVLCYSIAFPTALGIVWLIYRQSFIGVTYSDLQHRALRLQAWGFVACVLTVLLLVITLQSSFILVLSILVGFNGLTAITSRSILAFHHPVFFKPLNTGPWAVIIGLAEIGAAIGILYFFLLSVFGGRI